MECQLYKYLGKFFQQAFIYTHTELLINFSAGTFSSFRRPYYSMRSHSSPVSLAFQNKPGGKYPACCIVEALPFTYQK